MSTPELASLSLGDPPERWRALGFEVADSRVRVGGVALELGAAGEGIVGWELRGLEQPAEIDGLSWVGAGDHTIEREETRHPNGAVGIDHVVVVTPDFDRTAAALEEAGLGLRRIRDAGGFRQGFRRLGPAILELVEGRDLDPDQPARFWGLVVTVADLEALADRLGENLSGIRPAVQPGRKIATLRGSAGLGEAVAFMDPE